MITHRLILRSQIAAVVIAGIINVDSSGLLRIGVRLLLGLEFVLDADDILDRKSTRLNSSHT